MKILKYLKGNVLNPYIQEWSNQWKERMQPSASSKVLLKWNASGRKPKPETSQERTNRRIKEETKRTWRSDAADIAHGIGEAALSFHPYTAIPYFGAKVGQDILNGNVGWQTAVNASIPLFHLSPQVVGLKEATNVALEDAANAGSKTARNWRVAREINLNIKNNNIKSPSRYITKNYNYNDDGSVSSIIYLLHDPISGKPLGNGVISSPYSGTKGRPVGWIESENGAKGVSEDIYNVAVEDAKTYGDLGIESGWDLMEPQKTLAVTNKFPHTVIGESEGNPVRLLTGTTNKLLPYFIQLSNHHLVNNNIKYNLKTGNFEEVNPNIINGDKTSLKFFERKPSRISLAERVGIPKGDRGNLSRFQKEALVDLEQYINSGLYRQLPTINMLTAEPSWISKYEGTSALRQLIEDGIPGSGRNSWAWNRPNGGTYELVTDGKGNFGIGYNSYRMFDVSPEFNARVGEASASSAKNGYSKIFLTAPKNEARHFIVENPEQEAAKKILVETQSPRINKTIMRDFWSGVLQSLRPGSYLSGDEGMFPKGYTLIRQFKLLPLKAYKRDNNGNIISSGRTTWEDIRNTLMRPEKWKRREDGLSTDSYLALLKQANRKDSPYYLRYSPDGFTTFNSQSIDNKFISDLLEKTKVGEVSQLDFLKAFHDWVSPYNGMDAKIVNGEIVIPHPFLYKKKQGGKMNNVIQRFKEYYKKGGSIYIKPSKRGSFTRWCGGKVTNECILKGKNSSNPAIRKKATFALNVRKFKH